MKPLTGQIRYSLGLRIATEKSNYAIVVRRKILFEEHGGGQLMKNLHDDTIAFPRAAQDLCTLLPP